MKLVVFGLTVSSSWGNGHATLWRGLFRALERLGHDFVFFERDVTYYAGARDLTEIPGGELVLYPDWDTVRPVARKAVRDADVAIVTSYCPDGIAAADLIFDDGGSLAVFYDLDTPVTLARLSRGEALPYIGARGLADFDLVLSYTGGKALDALRRTLGARHAVPLFGHVDPEIHSPVARAEHYRADLSYLGTYAEDRQDALMQLFVEPARARREQRFVIGGALYPDDFPWSENIYFVRHLPPPEHPAFFSSSRLTLNVTRHDMAAMGWCPSGRLFEAAACGTAIISDEWNGLDSFYTPGEEILPARTAGDVLAALDLSNAEIRRIAAAARERTLAEHTSGHRAAELIAVCETAKTGLAPHEPEEMETRQCGA
jgi:spore maturation protein CgeB